MSSENIGLKAYFNSNSANKLVFHIMFIGQRYEGQKVDAFVITIINH